MAPLVGGLLGSYLYLFTIGYHLGSHDDFSEELIKMVDMEEDSPRKSRKRTIDEINSAVSAMSDD